MARVGVQAHVDFRDEFGRFRARLDTAAEQTIDEALPEVAALVRGAAPSGPARRDYGRRKKLRLSIRWRRLTGRSGEVEATAPHAGAIEEGSVAHGIPNAFGSGRTVHHPGTSADPFLRPVAAAAVRSLMAAAKRAYPG